MMLNAQAGQNSAVVLENTKNLQKLVLADRELKISEGSVFTILHENLSMRKLCSKWVPRLLTVDQKQQHIKDIERCYQPFQCNEKEFLCKYVAMDETWVHHFTPESKWQSAEWITAGERCPKWPKIQASAGKELASVFWDVHHISFIDYLEKGRTINSKYYIALLVRLKEEITKKWLQMEKKKVLFHQDNAPCHKSIAIMAKLHEMHFESFLHLIWSLATTGCLQTSKECSKKRDLAPMKKWYQKLRRILSPKTDRSTKRHQIIREVLESVYHPRRRLCWWIKLNFAWKLLFY